MVVGVAGMVDGFLGVHAVVDDVGEELEVALRLHGSAHVPEHAPQVAVLCR